MKGRSSLPNGPKIIGFVNDQNCKFVYFLLEVVFFVNSWFKLVIILLYVIRPTLNKIIIVIYYYRLYVFWRILDL